MNDCPHCNAPQADEARFCRSCGQSLTAAAATLSCPVCHSPNAQGARFCKQCGTSLAAVSESGASPAPVLAAESEAAKAVAPEPVRASLPATMRPVLTTGVVLMALLALAVVLFFAFREQPTPAASEVSTDASQSENEATPADAALSAEATAHTAEASPETRAPAQERAPGTEADRSPARPETKKTEQRTCSGLTGFPSLICRTEGPARFWRCAPDGVNWNNDIPGCRRSAGRDSNIPR